MWIDLQIDKNCLSYSTVASLINLPAKVPYMPLRVKGITVISSKRAERTHQAHLLYALAKSPCSYSLLSKGRSLHSVPTEKHSDLSVRVRLSGLRSG